MHKPYKAYKELKQKQKLRIANFMYRETLRFYLTQGHMPDADETESLCTVIYTKVLGAGYRVPMDDIRPLFLKCLEKYEDRIQRDISSGVTLESLAKKPKATGAGKKPGKRKKKKLPEPELPWRDDYFYFIAGYTSGGAPYGVTWEEMGLRPWQDPFDEEDTEDF